MTPWVLLLSLLTHPIPEPDKRIEVGGQLSLLADALPRRDVAEIRPQATIEMTARPNGSLRLKFDGMAEALVADRDGLVTDAAIRVREAWLETAGAKGDFRVGYGRLVWGRLDEVQPSDVINPLDTTRYILDGRSAARLPVAFMRGRVFAAKDVVIEGVVVPFFRRGSFDELDEASSPFNLIKDLRLPSGIPTTAEPERRWSNVSGGGRVSGTVGRVDMAAGVFHGFEGFGTYPRFTMVSGDFETVTGKWAWRGEAAWFVGRGLDAGAGFDRRTGEFRVYASVLLHREWPTVDRSVPHTDVNVVGSIERQFKRDRYLLRTFVVVNPADASGFVRALFVWKVRDNLAVDASAAMFPGTGDDLLSRFHTRDFLLARIRWQY